MPSAPKDLTDSIAEAMDEFSKPLKSAAAKLMSQLNRQRHESVLALLQLQHSKRGKPLEDNRQMVLASMASCVKGKGDLFARQIVKWGNWKAF